MSIMGKNANRGIANFSQSALLKNISLHHCKVLMRHLSADDPQNVMISINVMLLMLTLALT